MAKAVTYSVCRPARDGSAGGLDQQESETPSRSPELASRAVSGRGRFGRTYLSGSFWRRSRRTGINAELLANMSKAFRIGETTIGHHHT